MGKTKLPRFVAGQSCPKCGEPRLGMRGIEVKFQKKGDWASEERLCLKCRMCGYIWFTKAKDAKN